MELEENKSLNLLNTTYQVKSESGESLLEDSTISWFMDLTVSIDKVYTPTICIFGIFGNFISILVFYTKYHKSRESLSSSYYLSALAVSDSAFLLNVFLIWLQNIGVDILNNEFTCPTIMYLGQVTGFLSVWFIVAFTVERFFAVCYPLSLSTRCTPSRAKKVIFGFTLFATLTFSYVLVIARVIGIPVESQQFQNEVLLMSREEMTGLTNSSMSNLSDKYNKCEMDELPQRNQDFHPDVCNNTTGYNDNANSTRTKEQFDQRTFNSEKVFLCNVPQDYLHLIEYSNYIDSIVTFIIPFLIISILNLRIIFCVKKFKRSRDTMLASVKVNPRSNSGQRAQNQIRPKLKDYLGSKRVKETDQGKDYRSKVPLPILSSNRSPNDMIRCSKCQSEYRQSECDAEISSKDKTKNVNLVCKSSVIEFKESTTTKVKVKASSSSALISGRRSEITLSSQRAFTIHSSMEVTKTLLLVSSVFLILHCPSHIIRISSFILAQVSDSDTLNKLFIAQHWANFLFNTNFAVNFLLYCYSGKSFRHSVRNLLFSERFTVSRNATTATTHIALNNIDSMSAVRKCEYGRCNRKFSSLEEDKI